MRRSTRRLLVFFSMLLPAAFAARAQTGGLDPKVQAAVDAAAAEVLAASKVPSVSIAIVANGRLAYVKAYGDARVEPRTPATPEMRYSIGSISKQFTATAMLMLAEEGKLSLDDRSRSSCRTHAREDVKIRQLLSIPPATGLLAAGLRHAVHAAAGDVGADHGGAGLASRSTSSRARSGSTATRTTSIAGIIVEKVARHAAARLPEEAHLRAARHAERRGHRPRPAHGSDPVGYMRYGLGPLRVAPKEGPGWIFAAGELAMTPRTSRSGTSRSSSGAS